MIKKQGVYHKSLYCADIRSCSDGESVFEIFLLSQVQYCSNDRSVKWQSLTLEDRTGTIKAKIWSDHIQMEYEGYQGQIVIVKGTVTYYAGRPNLTVEKMQVMEEKYDLSEICRTLSPEKIKVYKEQISTMLASITDKKLQKLCSLILNTDRIEHMSKLPVHLEGHHTYRGALLEHTCEVVTGAYFQIKSTAVVRYMPCSQDLVIAGALLHDVSSTLQIRESGFGFQMDNTDRISGGFYKLYGTLEETARKCGMDIQTFSALVHIIDTSHIDGKLPMSIEAMIVRSVNRLSAEMALYEDSFLTENLLYGQEEAIIYSRGLRRNIIRFKKGTKDAG